MIPGLGVGVPALKRSPTLLFPRMMVEVEVNRTDRVMAGRSESRRIWKFGRPSPIVMVCAPVSLLAEAMARARDAESVACAPAPKTGST